MIIDANLIYSFGITYFRSLQANQGLAQDHGNRSGFCDDLASYAAEPYATKHDAPLMSPAIFKDGGKRCNADVMSACCLFGDVDGEAKFDDLAAKLDDLGLAALLYTTASNRIGDRFRIIVPLSSAVDEPTYRQTWYSFNKALGNAMDTSKQGAASIFYLPGQYQGADNRFQILHGAIWSSDERQQRYPKPVPTPPATIHVGDRPGHSSASSCKSSRRFTWTGLADCPFVKSDWVDEYLSLIKGQHYVGLYRFMCRIAKSAARKNYPLSAGELESLARQLDQLDGGRYRNRCLNSEAANAIQFSYQHKEIEP